jgi:hypothetical protein
MRGALCLNVFGFGDATKRSLPFFEKSICMNGEGTMHTNQRRDF